MPQIYNLLNNSALLKDVSVIIGEGLCSNIYILGKKEATLIDTGIGNCSNPIFPQLELLGIQPKNINKIILTHAHHDHSMGLFLILEKTEPRIFIHGEAATYISPRDNERLVKVIEGEKIDTEIGSLEVVWTPGHTKGSICLYQPDKKILFSGDTLFPGGGFGRFNGESGSLTALISSIKKLNNLDVEAMLPGHGFPIFHDANKDIEQSFQNASHWY